MVQSLFTTSKVVQSLFKTNTVVQRIFTTNNMGTKDFSRQTKQYKGHFTISKIVQSTFEDKQSCSKDILRQTNKVVQRTFYDKQKCTTDFLRQTKSILRRANRRNGVEVERSPRMREIGVRSPVATDRWKEVKTGSDSSTAKRSSTGVSVTGPQRWPL